MFSFIKTEAFSESLVKGFVGTLKLSVLQWEYSQDGFPPGKSDKTSYRRRVVVKWGQYPLKRDQESPVESVRSLKGKRFPSIKNEAFSERLAKRFVGTPKLSVLQWKQSQDG